MKRRLSGSLQHINELSGNSNTRNLTHLIYQSRILGPKSFSAVILVIYFRKSCDAKYDISVLYNDVYSFMVSSAAAFART